MHPMAVMSLNELNESGEVCQWMWDVYKNADDARDGCEDWCESFLVPYDGKGENLTEDTMQHYGIYTVDDAYASMERYLDEGTIVRLWTLRRGEIDEYEPGCYDYEGQPGGVEFQVMKDGNLVPWNDEKF